MTTPHIRHATPGDVPLLLPLVEQYWAFEHLDGFDAQHLAGALAHLLGDARLGAGWIALADDGTAAGYLLAVYVFSLEHGGLTAEIDEFFVVPGGRNRGLGACLLATAETEFARAGCTNVSLQLAKANVAARAFYHRHGYAARAGFELLEKDLR